MAGERIGSATSTERVAVMVRGEIAALEAQIATLREIQRLVTGTGTPKLQAADEGRSGPTAPASTGERPLGDVLADYADENDTSTREVAAAAAPPPAARRRVRGPRTLKHDDVVLEVLGRLGETPMASLCDHAQVPRGSLVPVCRRLEEAGKIVTRRVPTPGAPPRRVVRLTGQPEKDAYTGGGKQLGNTALRRKADQRAAQREAAEKETAGDEGTLKERIIATLAATGDQGLTMAQLPAAVLGDEPAPVVENRVRELWTGGHLARRRDGTFVVASTRKWHTGEDLEDVA